MIFTTMLLDSPHYAAMAMPLQIPSFDPFRRANSSLEIRQGRQQVLPPCPSYEEENRLNKKQMAVCLFV